MTSAIYYDVCGMCGIKVATAGKAGMDIINDAYPPTMYRLRPPGPIASNTITHPNAHA